jgi:hypothetical protein
LTHDDTRPLGMAPWAHPDKARLALEGQGFKVQLEGDEAFVRAAWRALRPELLRKVEANRKLAALRAKQPPAPPPEDATDTDHKPLLIHERHDLYEKALVAQRGPLAHSPLGAYLDVDRLGRVCVEHGHLERLAPLLGPAQPLWSRLTPMGQRKFSADG